MSTYNWDKENKFIFSVGLMRSTDSDIINFIEKETKNKSRNTLVKEALRHYQKSLDDVKEQ
jgi:hypothetical protein